MADLYVPSIQYPDVLTAAVSYAEAGWYVLPVDPVTKHPGSRVHDGWPQKSSRDPAQITAWFAGAPNDALALHCGRSGAVASMGQTRPRARRAAPGDRGMRPAVPVEPA